MENTKVKVSLTEIFRRIHGLSLIVELRIGEYLSIVPRNKGTGNFISRGNLQWPSKYELIRQLDVQSWGEM